MTQRKNSRTAKKILRPATKAASKTQTKRKAAASKRPAARRPLLHPLHISITALLLLTIGAALVFAGLGKARPGDAASCTVSDKLVNSCRPWLSATVGGYPMTSSDQQFSFFNKRLNNPNILNNPASPADVRYKMDIPHVYHQAGQALFNGTAKKVISDSSLYGSPNNPVLVNWKPGSQWRDVANGAADSTIVTSAKAVKELGSRKIFLTLWHEPENHGDVGPEGVTFTGSCKRPDGTRGSAADYRAMWRHVHDVFKREGVNNVVWFWNLTGYVGNNAWDCMVKPLWPGNDIVDWVMWDPYSSGSGDFVGSVSKFYNFLTANSDASHAFTSKPWGLAEFGSNSDPSLAVGYWNKAKEALGTSWSTNRFPNIKLYSVFDTSSNGGTNGGLRVGYNNQGNLDVTEQAAFNSFAQHILSYSSASAPSSGSGGSGSGGSSNNTPNLPPAKDTSPPTVTLSAPADGSRQQGTIAIRGNATDNKKVSAVTVRVDNKWVATVKTAPYEFKLDTKKYKEGKHSIVLRAWDAEGNMGQSGTVVITIDNNNSNKDDGSTAPSTGSTVVKTGSSSPGKPIRVEGTVIITPVAAGNSIQVWVGDKLQSNNIVDSVNLTNGTHTIKISENGAISFKTISVANPAPIAAVNHVRANAIAYAVSGGVIAAACLAWFGRTYIIGLTSRRESSVVRSQRNYRK